MQNVRLLARRVAGQRLPRRFAYSTAAEPQPHDGPSATGTNRAEISMKRFWTTVGLEVVQDHYRVTLDKRPLKTPSGNLLLIPKERALLANLIANEWENQDKIIKPHALPLTSLASRVIDGLTDEETRQGVRQSLLRYFDTDTISFHEEEPQRLVVLQQKHWNPLLQWVKDQYGVDVQVSGSILGNSQTKEAKEIMDTVLQGFNDWELAGMERAVYYSKSFIIALALLKRHLTVEAAALASQVEVNSQIELWGEVEDTHDVDFHDIRRQLGSVACLLEKSTVS